MSLQSSTKYSTIHEDDPDLSPIENTHSPPTEKRRSRAFYVTTGFLALAIWAISLYGATKASNALLQHNLHIEHTEFCDLRLRSQAKSLTDAFKQVEVNTLHEANRYQPSYTPLTCGSSSSEAESLGCVFDPLMASWLHKDCPKDGSAEFAELVRTENLTYWYDEGGKPTDKLIDPEHFKHLDGVMYWGTKFEHLTHCAFTLKRIIHAQHRGDRLDVVAGNFSHTNHCVNFLIEGLKSHPSELQELYRTDLPVQFLQC
ncbi:uncharacterized protein JN550_011331 [Neoarthrinium moseri]|uniref:uncharacterized protein n=1 Tax=Neoarthrinium moseri TaxID=1658444 RepID=UPI001FDE46A9|nr:uncharacterized protein JN550_011331 [Neoarthrinium moseri]KAI1860730.1 hypothetical protein JN550_011331 [Neoarthrinium moseri]